MPTFILLTKLSSQGQGSIQKRENIGREWFEEVKKKCPEVKWIEHYALLGPYDFMDIYEAPSEESAAKVSLITMSKGAVSAESWSAIPYKKFRKLQKNFSKSI
jgi:uncharacterized protein with GYD domain